ncbi:MAG TPA: hypothetical protein VLY21_04045 [Nitrososphaerales archaeon]|nr:hypothetical protein [Nitrososphaerales archaeon]
MSFGSQQARQFLAAVQGKAAVFIVPDRQTNLLLGRLFLAAAAFSGSPCLVLDMDAFYGSNSALLAEGLPLPEDVWIHIPRVGAGGEEAVSGLFATAKRRLEIIDDLNSLYHTFSSDDQNSAGRKLTFFMNAMSFVARNDDLTIMATIYERERPAFGRRTRLFAGLGDLSVSVRREGDTLSLRCDRGAEWPGGKLTLPMRP